MTMKIIAGLLALFLSGVTSVTRAAQETEQEQRIAEMKSDLVGHTMGGREEGWKFQSVSQIKELTIEEEKEEDGERICTVELRLSDPRVKGTYEAKAKLTYKKVGGEWKLDTVGLLSMKRVE
jgi:hypothetical protein